ncbi:MAG: DUF58 domain-containing protein [Kiritimatiellia bacterium]
MIAAEFLRYAGRLRLVLGRRALRGAVGPRAGMGAGSSLEFHDYRDYHPGDDVRLIDWNIFARSDRETIRRHREEVSPRLDLMVDESASMDFAGAAPRALADALADLLAKAAERAGCRVRRSPPRPAPRSVRVFISDLLIPGDPAGVLTPLARGASALHVIRLLPAVERHPAAGGIFHCVDAETGETRELAFDAPTLAAHAEALRRHTESWLAAIRRFGGTFTDLTVEEASAASVVRALLDQNVVEVVG